MPEKKSSSNKKSINNQQRAIQKEISSKSYEETITLLEMLLSKLQDGELLIEEIQETYIKGKLCIKHCEELLNQLEQSIVEINVNDI